MRVYRAPAELQLGALWASTMFCYIYGDYFGLFVPGALAAMGRGVMGPLGPASPGILVGVSLMMAVPSVMVALSLLAPAAVCRWANVVFGLFYTAIIAVSLPGSPPFYIFFAVIEMALTVSIAVVAFRWPSETAHD